MECWEAGGREGGGEVLWCRDERRRLAPARGGSSPASGWWSWRAEVGAGNCVQPREGEDASTHAQQALNCKDSQFYYIVIFTGWAGANETI